MWDGYHEATVEVLISDDGLYVATDSNVDMSYPEIGVQVDGRPPRPFRGTYNATSVYLDEGLPDLLSELSEGAGMRIRLGFWPTWPVTETQETRIELGRFKEAYGALMACAAEQD